MGELAAAIGSVRDFRDQLSGQISQATGLPIGGGGGGGGAMPIAGIIDAPMIGIAPPPDFSGMGASQAAAQMNPMEMLAAAQMPAQMPEAGIPEPQENPEPYQNPYTPELNKPIEEQIVEDEEGDDITVQGDTWKRKKAGWLGGALDTLLMLRGRKPVFQERKDRNKNIPSAMEGFSRDPERSFRRLQKINPDMALELKERYERARASNALTEERRVAMEKQGDEVMGGILTGLMNNPDPKAAYKMRLPTLRKYAEKYGKDPMIFGDEYDENALSVIRDSGMSGYQQSRLQDYDERLEQTERNTESQIKTREFSAASQHEARQNRMKNDNLRTDAYIKKSTVEGSSGQKYGMMEIRASNGEIRKVIVDRKKGTAYSRTKDGDTINYIIRGKEFVPVGVTPKKKEDE